MMIDAKSLFRSKPQFLKTPFYRRLEIWISLILSGLDEFLIAVP
jgi:hypothetical protein